MFILLKKIFETQRKRKAIASVGVGVYGQLSLMVSGVLTARILGVDGRGTFALLLLFPIILTQIGTLGLPRAVTYYLSQERSRFKSIIKNISYILPVQIFTLLLIHYAVLDIYLEGKSIDIINAAYLTLLYIPGNILWQYGLSILQVELNLIQYNLFSILYPTFYMFAILSVYLLDVQDLEFVVLSWSFTALFLGVSIFISSLKYWPNKNIESNTILPYRKMFKFGMNGMLGAINPLETFRLDQLVAGLFLTPYQLGLYVIGLSFTNIPKFISKNLSMVAFPDISRATNFHEKNRLLRKYFLLVFALTLISVSVLFFLMPILIPLFFGEAFKGSIVLAQILLIGSLFFSMRNILTESMRGLGYPSISSISEVSMYPWLLVSVIVVIQSYTIFELSLVISIAYLISFITACFLSVRTLKKLSKFNN